jgi:hypothetical protein
MDTCKSHDVAGLALKPSVKQRLYNFNLQLKVYSFLSTIMVEKYVKYLWKKLSA